MKTQYRAGVQSATLELHKTADGYLARIGEQTYQVSAVRVQDGVLRFMLDGVDTRGYVAQADAQTHWVALDGRTWVVEKAGSTRRRAGEGVSGGQHLAPMPGQVREVLVKPGDSVEVGQTLILLEAMKMEMRIQAVVAGVVERVDPQAGQQVNKDDVLVVVRTAGEDE
jgi:biotin carboxyl carrier protein